MESDTEFHINIKLERKSSLNKKFKEYINSELAKFEIKYKLLLYFFIAIIFNISLIQKEVDLF